jgi:endonuclease-3
MIQEKFAGELPRTIEELTELRGVGRKTANVLLGDAFDIQVGIVVDTHVRRLSNLIGLTTSQDPVKIEVELMEIVPKPWWTKFSHWLILHGRSVCIARRPKCEICPIVQSCDYGKKEVLR